LILTFLGITLFTGGWMGDVAL